MDPDKLLFYYWFFEPLKSEYQDDNSINPILEIPVKTNDGECRLSLFFGIDRRPSFMRFSIPGYEKEEIKEEHSELLQTVKEHLLSILRINYDSNLQLAPYTMWAFPESGKPYSYGITLKQMVTKWTELPVKTIKNAFIGTWSKRDDMRLLSDSLDPRIPLQYRYLSLYKIIENAFKARGKWNKKELKEFLNQFEDDYKKDIRTKSSLYSYIHNLRDKCAHIKTSKNRYGVTYLSNRQVVEVNKFLPFMRKMCVNLLNSLSGGKYKIGAKPPSN